MEWELKNHIEDTVLNTVLKNRGLDNQKINWLLNADILNWEDYNNYTNIDRAYNCLLKNIRNNNKIGILVDTDVDGYCSSSIIYMFIKFDLQYDNVYYIQHTEKAKVHGLTKEVMDKVIEDNTKLLITPDSSSENFKEQIELNRNGIDFIALDHHMYDLTKVPDTSIIINNKDGEVENIDGSGAMVTYKFIRYIVDKVNLDIGYKYIDLANVANISDSMDMRSLENRYIFNIGKQVNHITNPLILSFVHDLKIKNYLKIDNVVWGISPIINAIIRNGTIEDKELLFRAFIGEEKTITYKSKGEIKKQKLQDAIIRIGKNYKRKQKDITDKAIKGNVKLFSVENDKVVLIDSNSIDAKVTGLVANKFMNVFNKPILMIRESDNKNNYTGSVRCPNYIDNFKSICVDSKLFNWCKGHESSFGYEFPKENINKFIKYTNDKFKNITITSNVEVDFVFDSNININDLICIGELEDIWCGTIERPKFIIKDLRINTMDIKKYGNASYSFMKDKILFKKDFCSKKFFSKMINEDNNNLKSKDLIMNILFSIKNNENGYSYIDIIDVESSVVNE